MKARRTLVAGSFAGLLGCSADPTPGSPPDSGASPALPDPATVSLTGRCPADQDHGGFVLDLGGPVGFSGRIRDGVLPSDQPAVLLEQGGCQLLRTPRPFCDPPCDAGEICDLDATCRDYPSSVDLGVITLEDPSGTLEVPPLEPGFVYEQSPLPGDAPQADEILRLVTEDAALPSLVLHGVAPPALDNVPDSLLLARGQALALTWRPPSGLGRSVLAVTLSIDVHGGNPAWLACTLPDTGTATLPSPLVDGLLAAGVSGFPLLQLSRESQDHALLGDTCADLVVRQRVSREPTVAGHTPCNDDSDCPEGQTCDLALETCG